MRTGQEASIEVCTTCLVGAFPPIYSLGKDVSAHLLDRDVRASVYCTGVQHLQVREGRERGAEPRVRQACVCFGFRVRAQGLSFRAQGLGRGAYGVGLGRAYGVQLSAFGLWRMAYGL